jgi:hypothetical protein
MIHRMSRLQLVGPALALVAGLALVPLFAAARAHKADDPHHKQFAECARACADCMLACEECGHHCARLVAEGHKEHHHEHVRTAATCLDCADVCSAAAKIVARGGPFARTICQACVKTCEDCGKECAKVPDDEHMKRCADECQRCAKACRDMLEHVPADH